MWKIVFSTEKERSREEVLKELNALIAAEEVKLSEVRAVTYADLAACGCGAETEEHVHTG